MAKYTKEVAGILEQFEGFEYLQRVTILQKMLAAQQKIVDIQIAPGDLATLKTNNFKLCFAKKVGDEAYNVVWQSYHDYLSNNSFSWTPQYQMFGSNTFQGNLTVKVSTNLQTIGLGETCVLDENGFLSQAVSGGPAISLTMDNEFGSIHPGINQLSIGLNGQTVSTPIYVAEKQIVKGNASLTPVEKVLVWFEQNIETSTMFSTARSNSVEIDLTFTNDATRLYSDQEWSTPS